MKARSQRDNPARILTVGAIEVTQLRQRAFLVCLQLLKYTPRRVAERRRICCYDERTTGFSTFGGGDLSPECSSSRTGSTNLAGSFSWNSLCENNECFVDRWFFTADLLPKLMIVSNRMLVGRERRSSGASRHQLEARNKIYRAASSIRLGQR